MFDMSIGEIGVILIVMLIVLGPQKATETARNIGRFISKIKTLSQNINSEFNTQIQPLKETYNQLQDVEQQIHSHFLDIEKKPTYISRKIKKPLRTKIKPTAYRKKLRKNIKF